MLLGTAEHSNSFVQFIVVLLLFVFVLGITYFTTRWIAGYQKTRGTGKNIEILETCKITTNTYLQIVHIGNKYIAIGVGKDQITMLTELSEEELKIQPEDKKTGTFDSMSFGNVLDKVRKQNQNTDSENKQ